jgi:uncharacterized protein YegL
MLRNLNDDTVESMKAGGGYHFSATKLEHLLSDSYTLVDIVVDVSGSVHSFKDDLEKCVQKIVEACRKSPRADNLLLRLTEFNDDVNEVHGYKLLQNCNIDDYLGIFDPDNMTALYDATCNAIEACLKYGESLTNNSYSANAILFVITDGLDNRSAHTENSVKEAIQKTRQQELLESITTVLVGINTDDMTVNDYLKAFKEDAGFDAYVEVKDATPQRLAKLASFVSQSISSSSTSLGTGNAPAVQSLTI